MAKVYQCDIPDLDHLILRDPDPQICTWQGREALRLSGQGPSLLIIPDFELSQGLIEVDIGVDGAAYPGIAFRIQDSLNYELAYPQPHTSGKWDAIQYDPVFHGSNTWQLHHGPGSQQVADVPMGDWFHFHVGFKGRQAIVQVGEQDPLIVSQLAHTCQSGLVGLWTYLPAYFSNLAIYDDSPDDLPTRSGVHTSLTPGMVTEWLLEGFGLVSTEPSGILNLNRFLLTAVGEVCLVRDIQMLEEGEINIQVGFSDELNLQIDGDSIFTGENLYQNSPNWGERGYVSLENQVSCCLTKGKHRLTVILQAREYFGFGIALRIKGVNFKLLPAIMI